MKRLCALLVFAQVSTASAAVPEAYFEDGPFQPAQRLIRRGAHRQAVSTLRRLLRAHPDAAQRPQARYLLGLSLIHIERYDEAARLFKELAVSYPVLKDEHLFHGGRALFLWGNYLQAERVLAQVDPKGPQGLQARRLRARSLSRATSFERLSQWLGKQDQAQPLEPDMRLLWANAQHRTGDVLGAYRSYRQVWQQTQDAGQATQALLAMAGLRFGERSMLAAAEAAVVQQLRGVLTGKQGDAGLARLEDRLARRAPQGGLRAEVAFARGRIAARSRRFRTMCAAWARPGPTPCSFGPRWRWSARERWSGSANRTQRWRSTSKPPCVFLTAPRRRMRCFVPPRFSCALVVTPRLGLGVRPCC